MKIEFLIATMNRKDASFLHAMFQNVGIENINGVVINQLTEGGHSPSILPPHEGLRIFSVHEKGLSRSRNLALRHSRADVVVFSDDDVVYVPDVVEVIQKYHLKYPDEGILTFKATGTHKRYSSKSHLHSLRTVLRVSSLEVTVKKEVVDKGLLFDERFGLGSTYPMGEENILLCDQLRSGVKARFIPEVIVSHSGLSTGVQYTATAERARGAAFLRMLGITAIPLLFWFALKKYPSFKKKHSIVTEIYYLLQGGIHFLRKR